MTDDLSALKGIASVSRETGQRLQAYVALVRKWQPAENLISPKTLPEIWHRHVADSAQLVSLFPDTRRWLDFGTGAGFPGVVIAILGGDGTHVDLVESNTRKCAFLRTVIRDTGAPATVHEGRVESVLAGWDAPADRVTARAVASLTTLFTLAAPLMTRGVPAAFPKGEDYRAEIAEAGRTWDFDLVERKSRIGGGVILDVTRLSPKSSQASAPGTRP